MGRIIIIGNTTSTPPIPVKMSNQTSFLEFLVFSIGAFFVFTYFMAVWNLIVFYCQARKSKIGGKIRKLPFVLDENLMELDDTKNPRMFSGKSRKKNLATPKLNNLMRMIFKTEIEVPVNVRVISIKMTGFKYGRYCHEFHPINGRSSGSYYTYQSYGTNHIQVTRYVENGKSYVAGFCLYVADKNVLGCNFNEQVVKELVESEKYPGTGKGSAILRNVKGGSDFSKSINIESDEIIWNFEEKMEKKNAGKERKAFSWINDFANWV